MSHTAWNMSWVNFRGQLSCWYPSLIVWLVRAWLWTHTSHTYLSRHVDFRYSQYRQMYSTVAYTYDISSYSMISYFIKSHYFMVYPHPISIKNPSYRSPWYSTRSPHFSPLDSIWSQYPNLIFPNNGHPLVEKNMAIPFSERWFSLQKKLQAVDFPSHVWWVRRAWFPK